MKLLLPTRLSCRFDTMVARTIMTLAICSVLLIQPLSARELAGEVASDVEFDISGRDRSFEQQRYRASGLNLVTAAIVLWNTVYLEKSVEIFRKQGVEVDDKLLQHISPLGWEHIALTGEYRWPSP